MASPVRILYLDHAPIWGGAEAVLVTLLQHLDRQQCQPFAATAPDSPLAQRLAGSDVPILPVPFAALNQAGWRLPFNLMRSVTAVSRLIRLHAIALIHTNTVRAHIVGSLAGWLTRTPVIWTLHDNTFPPRLARWLSPIPRQVITVSGWLAETYAPCGLAGKLTVIPNGLNLAVQATSGPSIRAELGIPPDAPLVLNVGRLVEGKAPHLFIEAAAKAAERHPEAWFVLVGGADEGEPTPRAAAYTEQLAQMLAQNGLNGRLLSVGARQDVGRFYQAANIVVYNAVLPEGLPTVLLEAMAYARPVIASAIGGALEIVQNGRSGILTPANNAAALADAIHTLLSSPADQQAMGQAGLKRLMESFTVSQQVQKTTEIYLAILQGANP